MSDGALFRCRALRYHAAGQMKIATRPVIRIGTAGWAIPRTVADRFAASGSALQRYAGRFDAAEINSTFYRPHRPDTYARWRDAVPEGFRFAVKLRRTVTHEKRLVGAGPDLAAFCKEVGALGERLGPLLVQLPPSFAFDEGVVARFFGELRQHTDGPAACEPRNASWFTPEAASVLAEHRIARVAADPAKVPEAALPGGWAGLRYHRLHGSPRMYYSSYDPEILASLATALTRSDAAETWCIFDNTTSGAAAANALALAELAPAIR